MARQRMPEAPPVETLPAVTNGPTRRLSSLVPAPDARPEEWTTNLDVTTPRGKAMLIAACNPADVVIGEDDRLRFVATHYVVYPDEVLNRETGELEPCGVLALIDKDGRTFKTKSEYAPKSLHRVLKLYNEAEWARGMVFIITSRKSRGGPGRYHDLRVELPPGDPDH